jgi:hypothetical protein
LELREMTIGNTNKEIARNGRAHEKNRPQNTQGEKNMGNRSKKLLELKQADRWEVNACGDRHMVLRLLDRRGNAFAEAHGFDPDHLISALFHVKSVLAGIPVHVLGQGEGEQL